MSLGHNLKSFVQVPSAQRNAQASKVTICDINRQGSILTYVDISTFITISIFPLRLMGFEGSFSEGRNAELKTAVSATCI
jgi:hypothetical protein